ncbi:OLC1v1026230C1 [Oldenlandia corymbosa var. corymbosa]|uniref:Ubiquitin thioesterase OTU n=1 Tax=Oldenlandia corymbosa var. corymbosa TaxID=529605 RepID=A0AAV1C8X0_OLDCO|nr:OLC1v1026230C1 [Oldenlandia corymbosa var. corymbosa]
MLGVLCARPKPWLHTTLSLSHTHGSSPAAHIQNRFSFVSPVLRSVVITYPNNNADHHRRLHSSSCRLGVCGGFAASVWHAILPAGDADGYDGGLDPCRRPRRTLVFHHHDELMNKGEGSWNVAWDARPARWLHNPDSAWLLFGVCACLAAPPIPDFADLVTLSEVGGPVEQELEEIRAENDAIITDAEDENSDSFKVTGVPADGRCLFRAIAHVACLRKGEDVPDENRQRELADELRALVVEELLKRRKEAEWFIEGDFDAYVERIEKPYVWGGEPELLMASHVLTTPISVFMLDRSSGSLKNIANYGEEYKKDEDYPINVLFHGYGHYDILDVAPEAYQKVEA